MNASEPVQAPRTAWINAMRDEALRMNRPEIAKIVHIGWVIASYANSDGINASPGTDTIAAIVGSSEETVSRAKKVLKALQVLVEQRRPNTSSTYRLQMPLGSSRLDWDAHMHLYTDTPQARRKRRIKEKELADQLAQREAEVTGERPPLRHGARRGAEPVPQRVPEPVPAGGNQREIDKGPDKDAAGPGPRPPVPPARGLERHGSEHDKTQPALAPVPTPNGRTRRTTAAATQPPLLMAIQGSATADPDTIRTHLADHGVSAAMRTYGRDPVLQVIAADNPASAAAQYMPVELKVPCSYCEAPAATPCRNSVGLRGIAHKARLDTWDVAYAPCRHCKVPAGQLCTEPDGTPRHSVHPHRAELGSQMRAVDDQQHTGT